MYDSNAYGIPLFSQAGRQVAADRLKKQGAAHVDASRLRVSS
jgi:hypothetical protein